MGGFTAANHSRRVLCLSSSLSMLLPGAALLLGAWLSRVLLLLLLLASPGDAAMCKVPLPLTEAKSAGLCADAAVLPQPLVAVCRVCSTMCGSLA